MRYHLIVATCEGVRMGIGLENTIPWKLSADLKYFKHITIGKGNNVVVMGRKTYDSLPPKIRPLPNRINIVLSRNDPPTNLHESVYWCRCHESITDVLSVRGGKSVEDVFFIGGNEIYQLALKHFHISTIYRTRCVLPKPVKYDTVFPTFHIHTQQYKLTSASETLNESEITYQYLTYQPVVSNNIHNQPGGEFQYLSLIQQILDYGISRTDRTGTGVRSIFGTQMRYDLQEGFPLLTTKKMFLRGIVEELLWFMRGETDAKVLQQKQVHIWDGNSSREYLDSLGLTHRETGDCGPIYGFAFRHFGATYQDCHTDYTGKGYDQISEVIRLIREDPTSRRILISLWNPCDLDKVALPPCHVLYQFFVDGDWLSCSMYQRSGDVGLGVPFNIASASLLTYLLAHLTGKRPKELVHTIGDAHIYDNHLVAMRTQLTRNPMPFPKLTVVERGQHDVSDYQTSDFVLEGYESHPKLSMKMAV